MIDRMNSRAGDSSMEQMSSEGLDRRPFRMLTIFDCAESNADAASASRLVLQELGEDIAVDKNAWDIRLLDSPVLRGQAADQAANADVILIALASRERNDLLLQWLEEWQKNRAVQGGLLALIPSGEVETTGELAETIYEAAITADMDFLCRKQTKPRF